MKQRDGAGKGWTRDPGTANEFYSVEQNASFVAAYSRNSFNHPCKMALPHTFIHKLVYDSNNVKYNKVMRGNSRSQNLKISKKKVSLWLI